MSREFIIDGGVLLSYEGEAENVIIPDGVCAVAGHVFPRAERVRSI